MIFIPACGKTNSIMFPLKLTYVLLIELQAIYTETRDAFNVSCNIMGDKLLLNFGAKIQR